MSLALISRLSCYSKLMIWNMHSNLATIKYTFALIVPFVRDRTYQATSLSKPTTKLKIQQYTQVIY